MKDFDCNLCIHMNVCPAYMATQTSCKDYLPQGNVIQVVRCKGCKHWTREGNGYMDDEPYCGNPYGIEGYPKPDDFCSRGERR